MEAVEIVIIDDVLLLVDVVIVADDDNDVLMVVVFNGSIDIEDDNEFERADRSIGPS